MSQLFRGWKSVAAILVVVHSAAACSIIGPGPCTLIGCTGLLIEVTGLPSLTPVTVVVTAPDGSTRSASCTGSGTCMVSFFDFRPSSLTVHVSTSTQSKEVTVQPAYLVTRPNGRDCPPECRDARVTVAL